MNRGDPQTAKLTLCSNVQYAEGGRYTGYLKNSCTVSFLRLFFWLFLGMMPFMGLANDGENAKASRFKNKEISWPVDIKGTLTLGKKNTLVSEGLAVSQTAVIASITGTTAVCKNGTATITFSASGGIMPYTFYYTVDGVAQTITTGTTSSDVFTTVNTSAAGSVNYSLSSVEDINGIVAAAGTVSVTINPLPVFNPVTPPFPIICQGTTSFPVAYTTNNSPDQYNIIWDAAATAAGFVNVNPTFASVNLTAAAGTFTVTNVPANVNGTYNGTLVVKNSTTGCSSLPSGSSVLINPLPTVTITPSATAITLGMTATLSVPVAVGVNYAWSPSATLSSSVATTVTASPTITTTYTVTGTVTATGCVNTESVTITVNPALSAGGITSAQTICFNTAPAGLTSTPPASGGTGPPSYQWQLSTDNISFTDIPGENASGYSPGILTQTTYYRRAAYTTVDARVFTGSMMITVTPLPSVTVLTSAAAITIGMTATLTAAGADSYVWAPAANLSSTTGTTVTASPITTTGYTVTGTVSSTGCVNTASISLTVNPVLTAGGIGSAQTICFNTAPVGLSSTALASNGTGAVLYQWQTSTDNTSFIDVPGATLVTYSPAALTQTTYYRRAAYTSVDAPVFTGSIQISMSALPIVTIAPSATAITLGMTATLTAAGADSYVWAPSATLSSTTGTTVTALPITTTGYTVTGTVSSTGCVNTANITITVNPVLSAGGITTAQTICANTAPAGLSSTAPASGGTGTVLYQWQTSTDNAGFTDVPGATLVTYSPAALTQTTYYRRAAYTTVDAPVFTGSIQIAVNALPIITITPSAAAITIGMTATLTAAGADSYVWTPSATLSSTTGSTVTALPITTTGYTVTGTVSSTGCVNTANITITVNPVLSAGGITAAQTVCVNTAPAGLTSTAPASGGTGTVFYQWQTSTDNAIFTDVPGATLLVYSPGSLTQTTYYRRAAYTTVDAPVFAGSIQISINALPVVTVTTSATAITLGMTATLTAGGADSYVWAPSANLSSTTGTTVTALPITTTGYTATGTVSSTGCVYTASITLTVNPVLTAGGIGSAQTICFNTAPAVLSSTALASNGTGVVLYQWQLSTDNAVFTDVPGATLVTYSPAALTQTTYYRRAAYTSVDARVFTGSMQISISALPIVTIAPSATAITLGMTATLTAAGADSYVWTPSATLSSATGSTVTALPITTTGYTVTGTVSSAGCVNTANITITVNPVLSAGGITTAQTICANTAPAGLTSTVPASGGTGTILYQWQTSTDNTSFIDVPGATLVTYSPAALTQTTYYRRAAYTSVDAPVFTGSIQIAVNALPVIAITPSAAAITLGMTATLTAAGANSYVWTPSATLSSTTGSTVTASPITTTGYTATGTVSSTGCVNTASITLTVNPVLTAGGIGSAQTICTNTVPAAFSSTSMASGGTGTVFYQWQTSTDNTSFADVPGATLVTYSPAALTQTTYYRRAAYTTVDARVFTGSIQISINALPVVTVTPSATAITLGMTATLTAAGADSYVWAPSATVSSSTGTAVIASPITSTTYMVTGTVSATDCMNTASITLTVNPVLTAGGIGSAQTICTNTVPAALSSTSTAIGGTGTILYQWQTSTDNTSFIDIPGATSVSYSPTALTQTTYFRRRANTLVDLPVYTASVKVTVAFSVGGTTSGSSFVCANTNSTTLTLGGYTGSVVKWQSSTLADFSGSVTDIPNTNASLTIANLIVTSYYRAIVQLNGCALVNSSVASVTVNPLPVLAAIGGPSAVCVNASITVTNATPNGNWVSSNPSVAVVTNSGQITGLAAGTTNIQYAYTDLNGCTSSVTSVKTVNPLPVPTITPSGPTAFCSGGSVNLVAGGGTSYVWSSGETTAAISVTGSGAKFVQATDINGCSANSANTIITVNPLPVASISSDGPTAFCKGGSVNLSAGSAQSYLWNNGETSQTINITATGNQQVTVTDINGCKASSAVLPVTVHALPTATISANGLTSFCEGGSVRLTASGGIAYLWNSGETTAVIQVNTSSVKQVTVTDGNGCQSVSAVTTITAKPLPDATVQVSGPTTFCAGGSVTLTASAGNTYRWNTGETSQSITVTGSGSKQVSLTGSNGCLANSVPTTVTVNPLPVLVVAAVSPVCSPSSINLSSPSLVSGSSNGLSITHWKDAGATIPLSNPSSVANSGTYYIKGTSADGCSAIKPVSVSVNPQPVLTIHNPSPVCSPATISLLDTQITGGSTAGTVFSYWTDAGATKAILSPSAIAVPGTYFIKGVLPTGCTNVQPVTVNIVTPPSLSINNPSAVCEPATIDLGSAEITRGSSDSLVFSYWTDPASTLPLSNPNSVAGTGTYYIKGTATNGCSAVLPVAVIINPLPNGVLQNPPVNFICDGSQLILTAANSDSYQWYADNKLIRGATAATYAATVSGNYTVQFVSKAGCVKPAGNSIPLDLLTRPVLEFTPNSLCVNLPISFSNTSVVTNSGGINWQWDFGDGSSSSSVSASHTYRTAGVYPVTLTANNQSCPNLTEKRTVNYTIESPRTPIRYDTVKAIGGKSITLAARPFGASYLWQPATGLNNAGIEKPLTNLVKDQEYTIRILSAAGCTTTDTVYVKVATTGDILVGQGFTPNGDGVNDRCFPILIGIRSLTYFKIFNRWGNLVFQTNDATPQSGWDGKYLGKMQTTGSFTWVAEAIDGGGNLVRRTGNILLIN